MFSVIVWLHIGAMHQLSVIPATPEMCGATRKYAMTQPAVEHAICAGSSDTILKAMIDGGCVTSHNGRDFYCQRGYNPEFLK